MQELMQMAEQTDWVMQSLIMDPSVIGTAQGRTYLRTILGMPAATEEVRVASEDSKPSAAYKPVKQVWDNPLDVTLLEFINSFHLIEDPELVKHLVGDCYLSLIFTGEQSPTWLSKINLIFKDYPPLESKCTKRFQKSEEFTVQLHDLYKGRGRELLS